MKNLLFSLVNKLGYRVVNKKRERELLALPLKKYKTSKNFDTLFQSKYYIQNLEKKLSEYQTQGRIPSKNPKNKNKISFALR